MRALLLGIVALTGCAHVVPLPKHAELYRAKTKDGWEVALVRYPAVGQSMGRPVLTCHGIAANARNMDLDDQHSLARWLADHGREAWTMSLRATGDSDQPDDEKGRAAGYAFDAFWKEDLPAAIAEVRRVSGAESIDYIGHSMGGMVLYAYLATGGQGIHAAATLGTPTRLDWGAQLDTVLPKAARLIPAGWQVPSALGAHLSVPVQGLVADGPFQTFFYDPDNTKLEVWKRLMAYGTADVSSGVADQLVSMIARGSFVSADGVDLRAAMATIQTPIFVVAGRLDRVAITPAVKDGYRALKGKKQWLLVSKANGAGAEYGHMDLVVGEHAPRDVFTPVLKFFAAQEAN